MADQPDWLLAFIDIKDTSTAPLGQTGEKTAPADPEQPCPATIEGPYPLKMTWRELLTDFISACVAYENPFPFISPIAPAPVVVAPVERPSNSSSSAVVDTPSSTEEPSSPVADVPELSSNSSTIDTPSDSDSPSDTEASSAVDAPSSSSASAVGDDDVVMAAPCGAPTVIATSAQERSTDAVANTNAPTHRPTRRGGRAGRLVQARRRRAAELAAQQQQAEEAAGQQG